MPSQRASSGYIAPVRIGVTLWLIALMFTVTGLVSVLRYRVFVGAVLILAGLALGLWSGEYLA
jgi:hypothetical protein